MKLNILIIAQYPESYANKRLKEEAEKRGHNVKFINPYDLVCVVSNQDKGNDKAFNQLQRLYIKDIDVIIPRISGMGAFGSMIVHHFHQNMHIPSTTNSDGMRICSNKMECTQTLSVYKIPVPQTIIGNSVIDYDFLVEQAKGHPFVAKTLHGSQGSGVSIMETPLATKTALTSFFKSKVNLVFQEYINTNGKDVRAFVVDGQVVATMERSAVEGDFRSNISIGGKGSKITLSDEEKDLAIRAAAACQSSGVCGVDMMFDKEKDTYRIIECNSNPNLEGIENVTGVNVAGHIIDYAEKIAKKRKRDEDQEENATTEEKALFSNFLHSILSSNNPQDNHLATILRPRLESYLKQNKKRFPNLAKALFKPITKNINLSFLKKLLS
ncbi:MAG: RimK family alpha-L-glutamate ligase [Raineya sp.]|jgi:ribosomal protein S6--L-glutamate ligase|nr:RimK family alpha-L-glutamate ligase [Raineya sp.]